MQSQITANCMAEADFCKVAFWSFKALPVLQLHGRQPTVWQKHLQIQKHSMQCKICFRARFLSLWPTAFKLLATINEYAKCLSDAIFYLTANWTMNSPNMAQTSVLNSSHIRCLCLLICVNVAHDGSGVRKAAVKKVMAKHTKFKSDIFITKRKTLLKVDSNAVNITPNLHRQRADWLTFTYSLSDWSAIQSAKLRSSRTGYLQRH